MKVYFLVFFITLVLSIILPAKTDNQWHWKLFITFLPLFLFAALRVDFGNDYSAYELFYNVHHTGGIFSYDVDSHAEIGYQLLCYIMPSFRSLLVLNALLLCFSIAFFLDKNVPRAYLWLAILLIFLNPEKNIYGNLVGMRNGFVVTGFILGSVLIQQRKLFLYALLIALLSTIHTAALLFMPLAYFVGRNTKLTRQEIIIWIVVFIVLLTFSVSGLIDLASPFISQYFERYEYYIDDMLAHRGVLLTGSSLLLATLIFFLFKSQEDSLTESQNSLIRLGLLYVASAFLGSLAMRANYFYDMFFIGTVVVLFSNSKRNVSGSLLVILAVLMSFYSLRLWQTSSWVAGNPLYYVYTSILGSW